MDANRREQGLVEEGNTPFVGAGGVDCQNMVSKLEWGVGISCDFDLGEDAEVEIQAVDSA